MEEKKQTGGRNKKEAAVREIFGGKNVSMEKRKEEEEEGKVWITLSIECT